MNSVNFVVPGERENNFLDVWRVTSTRVSGKSYEIHSKYDKNSQNAEKFSVNLIYLTCNQLRFSFSRGWQKFRN